MEGNRWFELVQAHGDDALLAQQHFPDQANDPHPNNGADIDAADGGDNFAGGFKKGFRGDHHQVEGEAIALHLGIPGEDDANDKQENANPKEHAKANGS